MNRLPIVALAVGLALSAQLSRAHAQPGEHDYRRAGDYGYFVLGALTSFVVHEGGHLALDGVLGAHPTFEPVHLGPLPFFAIQPNRIRSDRQLYAISMMGFLTEAISNDIILSRHPRLRYDHEPFLEGMLAFNSGLDISYSITGLANVGPPQSDVNSMARAARIPTWAVGLMLLVPAAFDIVRYSDPDAKWAPWVARGARLVLFGTVFAFPRRRYADVEREIPREPETEPEAETETETEPEAETEAEAETGAETEAETETETEFGTAP
jgi:hypothetical protein